MPIAGIFFNRQADMEETRVLTVVFTDIKGFTERTSHSDREAVSRLLQKHEELLLPIAKNYAGTLVKTIGDAFLLTFASPTNAVLCAIMMQEKLKEFNSSVADAEKIEIRIAMNTGEVILRDGDVYGEPVNIAARIEALTDANEIWFSESTYLAMNRQEVPTSLIGEYRLKGIPEAIRVYRVVRDENSEIYARTVQTQLDKISNMVAATMTQTATPRSARPVYWFGLVILLTLAYFIFSENEHDRHLRLANEAFMARDYRSAIASLKKAVKLQPADAATTALIENTLNKLFDQRLHTDKKSVETLNELEIYLKETKNTFSSLDNKLLACEIELALQWADLYASQRQRNAADRLLAELAEKSGNRGAILMTIAQFYGRHGYNWNHTISYLHRAALTNPASYAANPFVLEKLTWFLNKVAPENGYVEVRNFIASHCFDHFLPMLQDSLYKPGADFHCLRHNARFLLSSKGKNIDLTRFHLVDLLTSPGNRKSEILKQTLNYFIENAADSTISTKISTQLASFPTEFILFENYCYDRNDPEIKLIAGPFLDHFKPYLKSRLTSDRAHQRINAFYALSANDAANSDEIWQYHAHNLIDFKGMQWSQAYVPALLDSIDYLIVNPSPEANTDLATTTQRAAKAAKALLTQIKTLFAENKDTVFVKTGSRTLADFEMLANKLQKVAGPID